MSKDEKIIRVTEENWKDFKGFLGYGMKEEFPPDEQLPMEKMLQRINAKHVVRVIQDARDNCGFILYNVYQTRSGPFALIEYIASVGKKNKDKGYGTRLVDDAKRNLLRQGVEQIIIETELVPRIVETPVHTDLEAFEKTYTRIGDLWIMSKGITRWDGIDKRDHFWGEMGFGIVPELPYCQAYLVDGRKERRVPMDTQIADIKIGASFQITISRIKDILMTIAEKHYQLGASSGPFVKTETTTSYSGRNLSDGSVTHLEVVPYRQLLQRPEVEHAMKMHGLQSRYYNK